MSKHGDDTPNEQRGSIRCSLFGHRWDPERPLSKVTEGTWFYRIDCLRCGKAVDGVACKSLRDRMPGMYEYARLPR